MQKHTSNTWTNSLKKAARALFAALSFAFGGGKKQPKTVKNVAFRNDGVANYKGKNHDFSATIQQVKNHKNSN